MADSSLINRETLRPFKCSDCVKDFTRKENLKRHVHTHHKGIEAKSFKCNQCDARFARSDLQKRHGENCHPLAQDSMQSSAFPRYTSAETSLPMPTFSSPTSSAWVELNQLMMSTPPSNSAFANSLDPPESASEEILPMWDTEVLEESAELNVDSRCTQSYFQSFHQSFPIIHEGSYDSVTAPTPLQRILIAIGSLYCDQKSTYDVRAQLFDTSLPSIQQYVEQNRSRYQESWVLQALLLLVFVGIHGGNDEDFTKAREIHRDLVDAMRMLQMSHDGISGARHEDSDDEDGEEASTAPSSEDEMQRLESRWQDFVTKERRKRCIYTLYLLDSQLSMLCNLRPMMSSLEIKYDLPCCEDSWLAKSALEWQNSERRPRTSSGESADFNMAFDSPLPSSQGYFYEFSQTLLHAAQQKHNPKRLRLLRYSPFTAVILVTQLQMMIRELTHITCLLERPKSQNRASTGLAVKQYSQILQGLRSIAELVPDHDTSKTNIVDSHHPSCRGTSPLWNLFWTLWSYCLILLSQPDSLLVSGVVECSLPLAIATSVHLQISEISDSRDILEARDVFQVITDLEVALKRLSSAERELPAAFENPFSTFLNFKISLVAWRFVSLTMLQAHEATTLGLRSSPSKFVLDAILGCIYQLQDANLVNWGEMEDAPLGPESDHLVGNNVQLDGSLWTDESNVSTLRSEIRFLKWMTQIFGKRATWPVGNCACLIINERLEKAKEAYNEVTMNI